jgi:serine/threonine protein kinase
MVKPKDPQDRPADDEDKTVLAATADQTVIAGAMETGVLPPLPEGNEDTTLLAQQAPPASPGLYTAAELPTRAVGDDRTEVNTHPGASPLTGRSYVPHASNVIKDRFVLESRLGKGGMGQVYKARDLRKEEANDDNPWVAIKFLGEEFSRHPKALISLQREAKKSQQLAHPNVLTVYDFDRDGDRVYMTMEMLQGDALSGLKKITFAEGKEPSNETLIEQMASGLAYAHENGLVHSDFKPDNVFVTTEGRVKILDFGIARIMDSAVQKDSFDAGELGAMTLRYASLEMLRRDSDPHPADDVYALGLIAYQLYAGSHPYGGRTALDALEQGLKPEPIKGIKRHQWRAIAGAIALERADRTPSAEQFLKEFSGTSRRNRILMAMVLVLALASGYFAWEASKPEGPAVPFAELPMQVQNEFRGNIDRGQQSAEIGDWDGASRYFIAAYALHPRNPEAENGLRMLVQHLEQLAPGMVTPRQQEYLLKLMDAYAEENEFLANNAQLAQLRTTLRAQSSAK